MEEQKYTETIDFQKYWLILKRHWLPAGSVWTLAVLIGVLLAVFSAKTFEAYGKLRFKKDNTISGLVTEAGEKIGKLDALNNKDTPVDTEAEVVSSVPIVNKVIKKINLTDDEGQPLTYDDFLKKLKVKSVRGTDILRIAYRSEKPEQARAIVDELMEVYLQTNVNFNRAEAAAAHRFMMQQLPKSEQNVLQADSNLRNFKERYQIVDLNSQSRLAVTQSGQLSRQIDQVRAELEKTNGRIASLQNKLGVNSEEALVLNNLNDSPSVQRLIKKLKDVEDSLASERSRFREENPVIINLKSEKESLEAELKIRVGETVGRDREISPRIFQKGDVQKILTEQLVSSEAEKRSLSRELNSLIAAEARYQKRMKILPELEKQQRDLERKLDAAQTTYKNLLKNLEQIKIAENQTVGNAQIISPATIAQSPVSAGKKITVGGGVILGGLLYVITAFILEMMDPSLKTTKEVRNVMGYKVLGTIPSTRKRALLSLPGSSDGIEPEHQILDAPNSLSSEAYKMLQTKLRFLHLDQQAQKVIAVTSSVPQEGKSTVSANLAAVNAELGSRVLLIDADLHRPRQHDIWNIENDLGLNEVLLDRAELYQAAKAVMPNLDVLTTGNSTVSSLVLFNSDKLSQLLEYARHKYDLIILDTPPVLLVADVLTLSKDTDGILMVVRPGKIDGASAAASRELLEQSRQKVLGLVVNDVIAEYDPDTYLRYAKAYSNGYNSNSDINAIVKY
jgi:succinoglycan biosynthesis transport protein ExoP